MRTVIFILLTAIVAPVWAQDCESTVVLRLQNINGGFFKGQKVTLTSKVDGKAYSQLSNDKGEATLNVPCSEMFELSIPNYTKKVEVESPKNGMTRQTLSYPADMLQREKLMTMTPAEQLLVDKHSQSAPDTTFAKSATMPLPGTKPEYYAITAFELKDINGAPLTDETMTLTGRKRNKSIKIVTDKTGRALVYLLKGDLYDVHFKYNRTYYSVSAPYIRGTSNLKIGFRYLGTKEIESRKKIEAARIAKEEKYLKEEKERFEKSCKALGITVEEGYRREAEKYKQDEYQFEDTVVSVVLNRNPWTDKLIICDVTGSMLPYVTQVSQWYRLHYLQDKNIQFVLFNDGDNLDDDQKKIGATGGIHYLKPASAEKLDTFVGHVQALGYGGDCPENNMEALIKGCKLAQPFKELIMVVDNDSPVKDIVLLDSFHTPVHVILCGVIDGAILIDYLNIAWKTKGTIHTLEEDITTLARMSEGQQITIRQKRYRIMGGEFVRLD